MKLDLMHGVEGDSIYLNDFRIAGPKPWGGGTIVKSWNVRAKDVLKALKDDPQPETSRPDASESGLAIASPTERHGRKLTEAETAYEGSVSVGGSAWKLCSDCPPEGYPTDETRCADCPRRKAADPQPQTAPSDVFKFPYAVTLWVDKEGDVMAKIPDLPGCLAHGKDAGEALKCLEDVMQMYLEMLKVNGQPVPDPSSEGKGQA